MDAARATLAKEFAGHEYVFVMPTATTSMSMRRFG